MKFVAAITVNHELREIEVDHGLTLLELLRDVLKIKSVHRSCGEGECGACTVLLDGQAVCTGSAAGRCVGIAFVVNGEAAYQAIFYHGKFVVSHVAFKRFG